jgi:enterochelin esterase family protein
MKKIEIKKTWLCTALLFFLATVFGQPPSIPQFVSPQVNSDNTVVFRLYAPAAKEVKLSTQFQQGNAPMTKDSSGVWRLR